MSPHFGGEMVTNRLNDLDENDENDDCKEHEREIHPFVPIGQGQVTDTTGTDSTSHGSRTNKADSPSRNGKDKRAFRFWQ